MARTHIPARNKAMSGHIGRLSGEAESSAMALGIDVIAANDGETKIMEHLDKSYAIDASNQLDIDLADFLDFTWPKNITVEQFISVSTRGLTRSRP